MLRKVKLGCATLREVYDSEEVMKPWWGEKEVWGRLKWASNVACIRGMKNVFRILVEDPEGKRLCGWPTCG
jgi:hypothetical protein